MLCSCWNKAEIHYSHGKFITDAIAYTVYVQYMTFLKSMPTFALISPQHEHNVVLQVSNQRHEHCKKPIFKHINNAVTLKTNVQRGWIAHKLMYRWPSRLEKTFQNLKRIVVSYRK